MEKDTLLHDLERLNAKIASNMKKSRLIIRNYMAIKRINILVKPITLFIGSTGAGKSTIVKLLCIFNSLLLPNRKLKTIEDLQSIENFNQYLIDYSLATLANKEIYIRYEMGTFFFEINNQTISTNFFDVHHEINELQRHLAERNEDNNRDNSKDDLPKQLFEQAIFKLRKAIYIPAERSLLSLLYSRGWSMQLDNIDFPPYLRNSLGWFQKAMNQERKLEMPYLNARFSMQGFFGVVELLDNKQSAVKLDEASSGFQAIIPAALTMNYFCKHDKPYNHLFALEEPELNLFPAIQRHLLYHIIDVHNTYQAHLLVATHSPYILTTLSNLIQAKNVVKQKPEYAAKVAELIPPQYWVDFDEVAAYVIENGEANSILNEEYQNIDGNELDEVSSELGEMFDKLLDLKYEND
jgi:predicted ATPase